MPTIYDRLIAHGTARDVYDPPTPAECLDITAFYDRLTAYGTAPDVYDPPTPAECLEIAALLKSGASASA